VIKSVNLSPSLLSKRIFLRIYLFFILCPEILQLFVEEPIFLTDQNTSDSVWKSSRRLSLRNVEHLSIGFSRLELMVQNPLIRSGTFEILK